MKIIEKFNNMKLAMKITVFVSACIFVGFSIFSSVILVNSYTSGISNAKDLASSISGKYAQSIEKDLETTKAKGETVASTIFELRKNDKAPRKQIFNAVHSFLAKNPKIFDIYADFEPNAFDGLDAKNKGQIGNDKNGRAAMTFTQKNGVVTYSPADTYSFESSKDYYKSAKVFKKSVLVKPYIDKIYGESIAMTSIISPILDSSNKFYGIVGIDVKLDYLNKLLEKASVMNGNAALITDSGNYVVNTMDTKLNGKSFLQDKGWGNYIDRIKKGESFDAQVDTDKFGSALRVFTPISIEGIDNRWYLVETVPMSEVLKSFYFNFTVIAISFIILVVALFFANEIFINKTIQPLYKVEEYLEELSKGNLQLNQLEAKTNDEIGELTGFLNNTIKSLKNLISGVITSIETISSSSEEMTAAAEQTSAGSGQVASSIQQLAEGAGEISKNVENSATNINKMNEVIQNITKETNKVSDLSNNAKDTAEQSSGYIENAIEKMGSIKNASSNISQTIDKLGVLSSNIGAIVDLIKSIATQTNLLALNAAIEAARAGENGKGFAVVADEVKKLAGESAQATDKITEMIKEIQNETAMAITASNKSSKEIEEGVQVVSDVGKALETIIDQVKLANSQIHSIDSEINDVSTKSGEIVSMVENISAVTEETAASTEEVSAITEEQTASLHEISNTTAQLAKVAEDLNNKVSIFKI